MTRVRTTLRLPVPEPRPTFDGYDLDALSLEFDAAGEGIPSNRIQSLNHTRELLQRANSSDNLEHHLLKQL